MNRDSSEQDKELAIVQIKKEKKLYLLLKSNN